jgi:hypothetical protein
VVFGPDTLSVDTPTASMTMCFVVIGLGTVLSGLVMRRDPSSGVTPPVLGAVRILVIPAALLVLATELHATGLVASGEALGSTARIGGRVTLAGLALLAVRRRALIP